MTIRELALKIMQQFSSCPCPFKIARFAYFNNSPVIGAEAMPVEKRIFLLVQSWIRHTRTRYESIIKKVGKIKARQWITKKVHSILNRWKGTTCA